VKQRRHITEIHAGLGPTGNRAHTGFEKIRERRLGHESEEEKLPQMRAEKQDSAAPP
jgi:hypothetical protein